MAHLIQVHVVNPQQQAYVQLFLTLYGHKENVNADQVFQKLVSNVYAMVPKQAISVINVHISQTQDMWLVQILVNVEMVSLTLEILVCQVDKIQAMMTQTNVVWVLTLIRITKDVWLVLMDV